MLGEDTPVHLNLLEIPDAVKAAEGTAMELDDCAFPLLSRDDIYHDDPKPAFEGCNFGLLVGARPPGVRAWAAPTSSKPAAGSSSRRARRSAWRLRRREGPGRGQPGQHERADRDGERS